MGSRAPMPRVSDLERAYTFFAWMVVTDGPVYAPLLDRMERELQEARRAEDVVARARDILGGQTFVGGRKAIR